MIAPVMVVNHEAMVRRPDLGQERGRHRLDVHLHPAGAAARANIIIAQWE